MKNREIGHIISKGGSVEDIQKVVSNFPSNPTKETFIGLGYAKSTAKRYISLLNQNNSEKAPKKSENCIEVQTDDLMNLVQSDNANYDNILVDTCALGSEKGRKIIENAKQVTFIFATLEEMDKKKWETSHNLDEYIKVYTSKILNFPNKYMLSSFKGHSDEQYPDHILLQYLQILPKQIRPTLLTADRNLSAKAAACELNYIYVGENEPKYEIATIVKKKIAYGIQTFEKNDKRYIFNNGNFKLEIHRDGNIIPCAAKVEIEVKRGDSLHVYEKVKSKTIEHIIDI